jgi:hypothetical protein
MNKPATAEPTAIAVGMNRMVEEATLPPVTLEPDQE